MKSKFNKKKFNFSSTHLIILGIFLASIAFWSYLNGISLSSLFGQPATINAIKSKTPKKSDCPEGCVNGQYQYFNKQKGCLSKPSPKCGNYVAPIAQPPTPATLPDSANKEYMTSCGWTCPVPDQTPTLFPSVCQDTPNRGKMLWANYEGCGCTKTELRDDPSCPK